MDRDLETICLKCLEKDPGKRYSSAAAMAEDLERWHSGEPILARRAGPVERALKWARRNPAGAGLVATSVLFILATVGGGVALGYTNTLADKNRALGDANNGLAAARTEAELRQREADQNRSVEAERQKGFADTERGRAEKQEAESWRLLYFAFECTRQMRNSRPATPNG